MSQPPPTASLLRPPAAAPSGGGPRVFYGWYLALAGLTIQALAYSGRYSFAVFFPLLLEEFHWPRDLTAAILSAHILAYGLAAPLAGWMVERAGLKRTMLLGTALLTLGLGLSGLGRAQWHFFACFGLLTGVGLCWLGSVPITMVIRNWFERKRGAALAVVYLGSSLSYGCYPAVNWLVEGLGWRLAFVAEGIFMLAVFVPLVLLVMDYHPARRGMLRDGLAAAQDPAPILRREALRVVDPAWAKRDWTLPQAIRTGRFWLLAATTFAVWGLANHLLLTHHLAFALDVGFARSHAANLLFFNGLCYGLGTLASLASDRLGREPCMLCAMAVVLAGIAVLLTISRPDQDGRLLAYACLTGLGYGFCVPVVVASMTDIFQGPRVGVTLGCFWFAFSLGGTLGPWLGGLIFERLGGYGWAFALAGLMSVLGALFIWLAAPRKVRLAPGRAPKS